MSLVLEGKYRLERRIGKGAFGEIFLGRIDNQEVAIKLERPETRRPQLAAETKLLLKMRGTPGVAQVYSWGRRDSQYYLVMQLLGPSLEGLMGIYKTGLPLKSVLMIGDQMVLRVKQLHNRGYLHRDIKPDNFLMGLGSHSSLLYLIDYGLAKQYWDPRTHIHIPNKQGKRLTGTVRYASLNTHLGCEQGRRDDIEGIAYVLIYLLKGVLPWQGLQAKSRNEKYRLIMQRKADVSMEDLCGGLPQQIKEFLLYSRGLRFEEEPDYSYLRRLLKEALLLEGYVYDCEFDWIHKPEYRAMLAARQSVPESSRGSCQVF